ncbi:MAG: M23 family metallopeptidase [Candidatus Omnitrophica bacterium]|nr:M23 family metallopeptidase [Candidatus Omnitrophota bacterium]
MTIPNKIRAAARILGFSAALAGLGFVCWAVYELTYKDFTAIVAPVPDSGMTLVTRADQLGEGHFGAARAGGRRHQGLDLLAPLESPVKAAKGGTVAYSGKSAKGMGEYIVIEHGKGVKTLYGHLDERFVETGARVRQGDTIGAVGKTGNAKHSAIKPHLHFELVIDGTPVDPASQEWLARLYTIERPPRPPANRQATGGR